MRRTILLADDSPTIQRLVAETFADADFNVVSVSDGETAIHKVEEIRPDVVLADVSMPGKNGYELCSYVRGQTALQDTPVILLAGAYDVLDETAVSQAGAASISKPFEPRALVDLVSAVLVEAEQRAAARRNPVSVDEEPDLLGLEALFRPATPASNSAVSISEADIDRIAERVIQKLANKNS